MFGPCTVQGEGRWSHLEQVDTFEIGHGAFHATQIAVLVQSLQYNLRTPWYASASADVVRNDLGADPLLIG